MICSGVRGAITAALPPTAATRANRPPATGRYGTRSENAFPLTIPAAAKISATPQSDNTPVSQVDRNRATVNRGNPAGYSNEASSAAA